MRTDLPGPGGPNLSAATLRHPQLALFFVLLVAIAGTMSYFRLGQREDPDFTFRSMVIRTLWPGATAEQVDIQVTDRIEKKLQEMPHFRRTRSNSRNGESLVVLEVLDSAPASQVPQLWYQARKKIGDIRAQMPPEVIGPFFNDEFGDVFGSIYAFTGDGLSMTELRDLVEGVRQALLRLPDVQKIELVGVQDDRIFVEIEPARLARLGVTVEQIARELQAQNAIAPGGVLQGEQRAVPFRVTGSLSSVEAVRRLDLTVAGRTFRLGDVATVTRGYADPPATTMRYRGREAIGLAVSMTPRGDVLRLGRDLSSEMARVRADLPVGVEFAQVSDQPKVVSGAVDVFMRSLLEAVAIVLAVSFLSLGARTGLVVALTIPLVLAGTFLAMRWFGIDLHRISTGALVIALGLLVDDAMIAVEMMVRRIEEGFDKFAAATYAYTTTAFPMLTGTLITAAGFLPIALARSSTGEYTLAMFQVVTIALLVSWVAAVTVTPLLGYWILKGRKPATAATAGPTSAGRTAAGAGASGERGDAARGATVAVGQSGGEASHPTRHEVFDTRFYRALRRTIDACIRHRWLTLGATAGAFVLGVVGMQLTEKQFFPNSDRTEVMVELWLPEGSSFRATEAQAIRLEKMLAADADVQQFVAFVGNSPPRYFLSMNQELLRPNFASFLVLTADVPARDRVVARLRAALVNDFPGVRGRAVLTPLGPPVSYPVQFRISGPDPQRLKAIGEQVAEAIRTHPHTTDINLDWGERTPALHVEVDQDRARAVGVTSTAVARALAGSVNGVTIGQYRERDKLIDVVLRAPADDRASLARVRELPVPTTAGGTVPVSQVAQVRLRMEEPILHRYSRMPTLTARADIVAGVQAPDVSAAIDPSLDRIRAQLPPGYRIEAGGAYEENRTAQASISAGTPLMLGAVVLLLMLQLQNFSRTAMVLLTAPLGVVGVALGLLLSGRPFGFVAMLGTIALAGMIMRNTVILVDQIQRDRDAGTPAWEAIREAAVRRFRPISLTAAAAVFAMVPLARSVLWGPMAVAIMGGLIVATALTILAVPALYAAWYRVEPAPADRRPPRAPSVG